MRRTIAVPLLVLALGLTAIAAIGLLLQRSQDAREAQLTLAQVKIQLNQLQTAPFRASAATGGSPTQARAVMDAGEGGIRDALAKLRRHDPPPALTRVDAPLHLDFAALEQIYKLGASGQDYDERADRLATVSARHLGKATALLDSAGGDYRARADSAQTQATAGSTAVILALLLAFALLYRGSVRARETAEGSEERFRTLVSNMHGAAYRRAADADWTMQFVSDRIEEISGHSAAALHSFASIVGADQRERVARELDQVGADGAFRIDYAITHADGGTHWVSDRGHVVRDADGAIAWIDGAIVDVTDVKRLEQERERIELELRVAQRLEAVGQLASGIAHEINTPIQFVGDSVRFLKDSFADLERLVAEYRTLCSTSAAGRDDESAILARMEAAEEAADLGYIEERGPAAFERTLDGLERVGSIVRAMKDFGRPQQLEQAPADLNETLRSTLVVAQNEYKYVADVETDFGDLPPVTCNAGEIGQVFLNLVVNAAHAISDAAEPGIAPSGVIRVRTACEGGDAVISVADTGTGIPAEIRERIFDPFFTTKEVGRGSGQGLAISRAIVTDRHGGSIRVESEPGQGTTFEVRLPIRQDAGAATLPAAA